MPLLELESNAKMNSSSQSIAAVTVSMFDTRHQSFTNDRLLDTVLIQISGGKASVQGVYGTQAMCSLLSSLGVILWQFVSAAYPFATKVAVISGPGIEQIRSAAVNGDLFNSAQANEDPLVSKALELAHRCCNLDPRIRPSGAEVAHVLDEMLTLAAAGINPTQAMSPLEEVGSKERVRGLIKEYEEAEAKKSVQPIASPQHDADFLTLAALTDDGDATAAYLIGVAKSYCLVEQDLESGDTSVMLFAGHDPRRGR